MKAPSLGFFWRRIFPLLPRSNFNSKPGVHNFSPKCSVYMLEKNIVRCVRLHSQSVSISTLILLPVSLVINQVKKFFWPVILVGAPYNPFTGVFSTWSVNGMTFTKNTTVNLMRNFVSSEPPCSKLQTVNSMSPKICIFFEHLILQSTMIPPLNL